MDSLVVQTPPHLLAPELVITASTLGATGILDLSFFPDEQKAVTHCALHAREKRWGVRWNVTLSPLETLEKLLCKEQPPILILSGDFLDIQNALTHLPDFPQQVIPECSSVSAAVTFSQLKLPGVILRGYESGGEGSPQTSFVLFQAARATLSIPFWIAGGLGMRSAGALHHFGAAGVVISEPLWLTDELQSDVIPSERWTNLDGGESVTVGNSSSFRFDHRFGKPSLKNHLSGDTEELSWSKLTPALSLPENERPLPVGQDVCFASRFQSQLKSAPAIIGCYQDSLSHEASGALFLPNSSFAKGHGLRYPIFQGPMTRVSDSPHFLKEVADAGALPFLALAERRGAEAQSLLLETKSLLKEKPWGVGLLGFLPQALREEQFSLIAQACPNVVIIAGGNPEQAKKLEQLGIRVYLHTPSIRLLLMFLKEGVKNFVLEGCECGGHTGTRSSLVLWESAVHLLLENKTEAKGVSLVAAGGIHDSLSASIASHLLFPLREIGVDVGLLMGSAYLFTDEAVSSGAILKGYQQQVLAAKETRLLEAGVGYKTRCLPSSFTSEFAQMKKKLVAQGLSERDVLIELEKFSVGRLRIASKGLKRKEKEAPELERVSPSDQKKYGMYMVGDVATIKSEILSIEELHADVTSPFHSEKSSVPHRHRARKSSAIAIVSMECIFPGAHDLSSYWKNILQKRSGIREVDRRRWNAEVFFDEEKERPDKTYSKWGGFLDEFPFDPISLGVPPSSLSSISANQLLALEVSKRALSKCALQYREDLKTETAAIFGSADAGELGENYAFRSKLDHYISQLDHLDETSRDRLRDELLLDVPEWSADSLTGILQNIVAGRIANRLGLGGVNFAVDAACATSFAALDVAVRMLRAKDCSAALVGAVDTSNSALSYTAFSKTYALSPSGKCLPFDKGADGIVLGEGAVALVLRRLEDAERDGDTIYAVLRGLGSSSDGSNESLTAPHVPAQVRALRKAYRDAGVDPTTIQLIEAHGTGTVVGDEAELTSLSEIFGKSEPSSISLGSVKSMIGHTKTVAGFAGLIKAAMSLHQKALPPTLGGSNPHSSLQDKNSPFSLSFQKRPWISQAPRRAAVSAFGFGGTNYHVVLEEGESEAANIYPRDCEVLFLSGDSESDLKRKIDCLSERFVPSQEISTEQALRISQENVSDENTATRMAMVLREGESVCEKVEHAKEAIASKKNIPGQGIYLNARFDSEPRSKLCLLFPGQGVYKPGMFSELVLGTPWATSYLEVGDAVIEDPSSGSLSKFMFLEDGGSAKNDLSQTALSLLLCFAHELLKTYGVRADLYAGHSLGEYSALCSAGAFSIESLVESTYQRSLLNRRLVVTNQGGLAVALISREKLEEAIQQSGNEIFLAGDNSPEQSLFGGGEAELNQFLSFLRTQKVVAMRLSVPAPYHTPHMNQVASELGDILEQSEIQAAQCPVLSNVTGAFYPDSPKEIRKLLVRQMTEAVEFQKVIHSAYESGVRTFVEIGPGGSLARLLGDYPFDDVNLLSLEQRGRGWLGFGHVVSELFCLGHLPHWSAWYSGREIEVERDLQSPYRLDGSGVRLHTESEKGAGKIATRGLPGLPVQPQLLVDSTPSSNDVHSSKNGASPSESVEGFRNHLIQAISECTGYPSEMLGLELDFISELGIDSIRRVEIASKLIAVIPSLQQKNSPEDLSELIQLRSIQEIRNWYQKKNSASALEDFVDEESHVRGISSYVPVNEKYDGADGAPIVFPDNGVVILIGAQSLYSDALVDSFKQRGVCSLFVSGESFEWVGKENTSSKTLLDISSLAEVEDLLSSSELIPVGLFFLGNQREGSLQNMCSQNFFEFLQLVQRSIPDRFDSFCPMLGSLTFEGSSPEEAGPTAILKTLAREDDRFRVRCLQFSREIQQEEFVRTVWKLFQIEEVLPELVVAPTGNFKRNVALRDEKRAEKALLLSRDSVLVITGGLSGVTFEVTRTLLRKYSTKLVVLGRTPLSKSSERQSNYAELENLASAIRYVLCDVGDEDALSACIKDIYGTEGRIDGVIHGAGIIRDSLIRDKKVSDFVNVYRTKTQILPVLERELRPTGLQFLVLFSSVAGQFGSVGQADYAAANAVLNSWAVGQQAIWKDSKILSINWGPWSGGMMSAELQKLYSAAGVELISLKEGGELFVKELESNEGDCPIVIISGSLDVISSRSIGQTSKGSFQ